MSLIIDAATIAGVDMNVQGRQAVYVRRVQKKNKARDRQTDGPRRSKTHPMPARKMLPYRRMAHRVYIIAAEFAANLGATCLILKIVHATLKLINNEALVQPFNTSLG
jgi:hypothetical protein